MPALVNSEVSCPLALRSHGRCITRRSFDANACCHPGENPVLPSGKNRIGGRLTHEVRCLWLVSSRRAQLGTGRKTYLRIRLLGPIALYADGPDGTPGRSD